MSTNHTGRVVLVTGATRGLGRETCRQLIERGDHVVLSGRAPDAAAAELGAEALALDVTDADSIAGAVDALRQRHGRIDVLVNNAGISMRGFDADVALGTLAVNYGGAVAVTDAVGPLLADDAVVVNVSSGMGELSCLSEERRRDFEDPRLSRADLDALMGQFITDVADGCHSQRGWPSSAYRVSKVGLNAFTRILARERADTAMRINAVCPGWVRTDMGGSGADRAVGEGAASIVWAATLPADGPTGGFFRDGVAIPW